MNNKKTIKILMIIIISILLVAILISIILKKVIPIYSISDRTQTLAKKQKEDDTVFGWLRVQGTNIDYPVVYSQTDKFINEEYDYDYLWTNSMSTTLNSRVLIWGHNIRNVSSKPLINEKKFNYFENLPSFLYYDFVKENKYIQYTINGENHLYKIYAVSMIDKDDFSSDEYMTKEDRKKYVEEALKESYFKFDTEVNSESKLITLATCTRFFGNNAVIIRVDGVSVGEGDKIKNYKVEKNNKNYEKVEKIMKGDDKDE